MFLSKVQLEESVTVDTVRSRPIYPCAICARVLNALMHVRALDGSSIVSVAAEADFRDHSVCVSDLVVFGKAVV